MSSLLRRLNAVQADLVALVYKDFIDCILATRGRFGLNDIYHERHHILPRCLNGTDDEDNLIDLTSKEHFQAHKLLLEENPDNVSLMGCTSYGSIHEVF